jgi:tRNA(fMet)-specific endonuclease VapC
MTTYCFDTDVLSEVLRPRPPMELVRRLATLPPDQQATTTITMAELLYGALKKGSARLSGQVRELLIGAVRIVSFDEVSAEVYAALRTTLESTGRPLAEPDLRIAAIAIAHDLTLVTGNTRHFARVPDLVIENWLTDQPS